MHSKLVNRTGGGRTDYRAVHLILGRNVPFHQFPFFGFGLSQVTHHVRSEGLLGLKGLQARLADFGARLGDLRGKLTVNAVKMGSLALQSGGPRQGHELLPKQVLDAFELAARDAHLLPV